MRLLPHVADRTWISALQNCVLNKPLCPYIPQSPVFCPNNRNDSQSFLPLWWPPWMVGSIQTFSKVCDSAFLAWIITDCTCSPPPSPPPPGLSCSGLLLSLRLPGFGTLCFCKHPSPWPWMLLSHSRCSRMSAGEASPTPEARQPPCHSSFLSQPLFTAHVIEPSVDTQG